MHTIALVNQKGGSGKTTLAVHLAQAFQNDGQDTVLLDMDPQASAAEWADARQADAVPPVISVFAARLKATLEESRKIGAAFAVVDTAPHSEQIASAVVAEADLIIMPVTPSILDMRATAKTVALLDLHGKRRQAHIVLNSCPPTGTTADEAAQFLADELDLQIAPVRLIRRLPFQAAMVTGQTVFETHARDKAAFEAAALRDWVYACLHVDMRALKRDEKEAAA